MITDNSQNVMTERQFDDALACCRELFAKKLHDYGAAWRVLRPGLSRGLVRTSSGSAHDVSATYTLPVSGPNSDFDLWWLSKKVWNPWAEGGESYWDTGNKGAATMGQSNSIPSDQTVSGTGYCAELQSKFVGLGPVAPQR